MAGWDEGYVSDVIYTSKFHRETTPVWLATAALLLGHRPPDLARPFRYADLGCGHGLTALVAAATCPHAEVWGFDFNPAHIESARELASRAGLANVQFHETSFATLAELPAAALPEFDFIISHGVMSWVSPDNQRHLVDLIGQRLRPGGLAYVSYNVATGWGAMPPLRALMRSLTLSATDRSDRSASRVLDYLDNMKQAGARFFAFNPALEQRLADIRKQDARYIAHEFLNQDWHPLMFADVAARLSAAKCSYIGSATLAENIDIISVPSGMVSLLAAAPDAVQRETLRDFALAQSFRRDIYRRGVLALSATEHNDLLGALPLAWLGRAVTDPIKLQSPVGTMEGLPEIYGPLVQSLAGRDSTFGEMLGMAFPKPPSLQELLQAITLLIDNGYVHPALPAAVRISARESTDRLNAALGTMTANGNDVDHLASPLIGSALHLDLLDILLVREHHPTPPDPSTVAERLLATLMHAGRTVQRNGQPVTDRDQALAMMDAFVTTIMTDRMPSLRHLGIVPTERGTARQQR